MKAKRIASVVLMVVVLAMIPMAYFLIRSFLSHSKISVIQNNNSRANRFRQLLLSRHQRKNPFPSQFFKVKEKKKKKVVTKSVSKKTKALHSEKPSPKKNISEKKESPLIPSPLEKKSKWKGVKKENKLKMPQVLAQGAKEVENSQERLLNAGLINFQKGDYRTSEQRLKEVSAMNPTNSTSQFAYSILGQIYLSRREYESAAVYFDKALKIDPSDDQSQFYLGRAKELGGNRGASIQPYLRATELNPSDSKAWLFLGEVYLDLDRPEKALEDFLEAEKKLGSKNFEINYGAARAYYAIGKFSEALDRFIPIVKKSNSSVMKHQSFLLMGNIYQKKGLFETARQVYQKSISLNPSDPIPYYNLSITLDSLGEKEKSKRTLDQAMMWNPSDTAFLLRMEKLYEKQNETEKAIQILRVLLSHNPRNLEVHRKLGWLLYRIGKFPQAYGHYKLVAERSPEQKQRYKAWNNLGLILEEQGRFEEALDAYGNADKSRGLAWLNQSIVLRKLKRYDEALKSGQVAVDKNPNNPDFLRNLAQLYLERDRIAAAISLYEQLIHVEGPNLETTVMVGDLYVERGDKEKALGFYQEALEQSPTPKQRIKVLLKIAEIQRAAGRPSQALMKLREAYALNPSNSSVWYLTGLVYKDMGKDVEAVNALQRSVSLQSNHASVYAALGSIYYRKGFFEEAYDAYQKARSLEPTSLEIQMNLKQVRLKIKESKP